LRNGRGWQPSSPPSIQRCAAIHNLLDQPLTPLHGGIHALLDQPHGRRVLCAESLSLHQRHRHLARGYRLLRPAQRVEDHPERLALCEPLPPLPPQLRDDGVGMIAPVNDPDAGVQMQDVGA
jgi:hypothetical protein